MKISQLKSLIIFFFGITLLALQLPSTSAQETAAQEASAGVVLGQLSEAFSGGHAVHEIQLSGSAEWHSGGLVDSGSASLTASADGSSNMQLSLATTGQRAETVSAMESGDLCQWAKADGIVHPIEQGSCRRSVTWFVPALSLQPTLLHKSLNVFDLGMGKIASESTTYRHLQSRYAFSGLPNKVSNLFTQKSTSDIGLDPTTLLPTVLIYTVIPDKGFPAPIAIEIRYSDYRTVDGVKIPYLIQRYVNHSLQLEVRVSSAQAN